MTKNPHPTTVRKTVTKKKTVIVEKKPFGQWMSWRIIPLTEQSANRLAETLINWVHDTPEALCFDHFLEVHCLNKSTYYQWLAKFEILKDAHEQAIMILGRRREEGGLKNVYNTAIVKFTMPYYNKKLNEHIIETANAIKKTDEEIEASARIVLNMAPFPESDLVPKRMGYGAPIKGEHE